MKRYAIIVAAGKGSRMGTENPKQFMELLGLPVLMHTISRFYLAGIEDIILVLHRDHFVAWESLCKKHDFHLPLTLAEGGATRFDSVRKGLKEIREPGLVAVHDGARPLVSEKLIRACFELAGRKGTAVPAIPCPDSIRRGNEDSSESVNRQDYYLVQTPQCFRSELLIRAYDQEFCDEFTDDATVVESKGGRIFMLEGERGNIKITYAQDLKLAEVLFRDAAQTSSPL